MALLFSLIITVNAQSLSRLVLINASTDAEIKDMPASGETIDMDTYPFINFRAITSPEPLDGGAKCSFKLTYPDGTVFTHAEGTAVYACFGDQSGDYLDWERGFDSPPAIQNGDYTLEVTPGAGAASSFTFTVSKTIVPDTGGGEEVLGDPLEIADGQIIITGEKKKWHNITLNCGGPKATEGGNPNPFKDYRFDVTFTKDSKTITVPGYFAADGNAGNTHATEGKVWKVHFCPDEVGTWTYSISFVSGTDVAINGAAGATVAVLDGKTGTIDVAESDKIGRDFRARGRLKYNGGRYLQFQENGEYYIKAGPDSPENFLAYEGFDNTPNKGSYKKSYAAHAFQWREGDPTWLGNKGKSIIGSLNYLASKGLNSFSFLTMNISGDDKNVYPYISDTNYKQFDCSKLDQWAVVLEYAQSIGLFLHFKTQETENERKLDDGNTTLDRALYYRELIARFGHHLALNWNLGEENGASFNEGKRPLQNDAQRIAMAQYFKDNDPYKNHVVLHTAPGDQDKIYTPLLGTKSELTGASIQCRYNQVHDLTKTWIAKSQNAGKAWVIANDEQGPATWGVPNDSFVSGSDSKGNTVPNKHAIRHQTLWGNIMAGGAGVEYYFGYDWNHSDLTCQDFTTRNDSWEYCKHALDFFNLYIPFWEMSESDNLTSTGFCLSKTNVVYAVYMPNGGSANVILGTGTYSVKWFNPRDGGDLQDGATGITGGGAKSITAPDNDDWVALITESNFTHNGNSGAPTDVIDVPDKPTCDPIVLTSYEDFPMFSGITGFEPAYKDNNNQCLAINAANYKDKFAAAQSTFTGTTGTYDITINTLCELDGESTYKLKIDGQLIGEFKNPETTTDYSPASHTWTSVSVGKGAEIQVEFSSHTNGKIPEGNITAYSRGRWKNVTFIAEGCGTVVTGDKVFIENDGYLVIEAESASGYEEAGFVLKNNAVSSTQPTGKGYLRYSSTNNMNSVNTAKMVEYDIRINTPGTYRFLWRNARDPEAATGDAGNDSWIFIEGDGCRFYGTKNASEYTLDHHTKAWVQKDPFVYECYGETHAGGAKVNGMAFYATFDKAGDYKIEYGGRSAGHCVDRLVLFLPDKAGVAKDPNTAESPIEGGVTLPDVLIQDLYTAYDTIYVFAGESYALKTTVSPENTTNKKIDWSSEVTTVAIVDASGNIKGLRTGSSWIYAVSNENDEKSDSCFVHVLKDRSRVKLAKTDWTVLYADSESENSTKDMAIDGDMSTFWHTEWKDAKPALPHEIHIDLGKETSFDFIDYYSRQDEWGPNGSIGSYEIFVSNDESNWGEAVKSDYIRWAKNPGKEEYKEMRRIFLSETTTGRYLKVVALSEAQNNTDIPFTAIAELDLWWYDQTDSSVGSPQDYGVDVYPNPFIRSFQVYASQNTIVKANVYALDGKLITQLDCSQNPIQVQLGQVSTGIYILQLTDSAGNMMMQKMVKK